MIISKLETKLMALILTAVMVLTGFIYAPKTASADETPTAYEAVATDSDVGVEILGATLRLSQANKIGTQAIRIGIKVNNADKAKACAITLTVGSKSYTVGTKDAAEEFSITDTAQFAESNSLYAKDDENKTITYTVVLKDIPARAFDTKIGIKGTAIAMDNKIANKEATAEKSVNDVIDSINNKLGENAEKLVLLHEGDYAGTLVYKYAELDMSTDESYKTNDEPLTDKTGLNKPSLGKPINNGCQPRFYHFKNSTLKYITNTNDPYYHVTTGEAGKGIAYDFHWSGSLSTPLGDYILSINAKTDDTNTTLCLKNWGNSAANANTDVTLNGDWATHQFKIQEKKQGSHIISFKEGNGTYDIRSFVVYKVFDGEIPDIAPWTDGWNGEYTEYRLKLDETAVWTNNNVNHNINSDGSISFNVSPEANGEFGFRIPEDVYTSNRFTEAVIVYKDNKTSFSNHVIKYGTSNPDHGADGANSDDARYNGQLFNTGSGKVSIKADHYVNFNKEYCNNFSAFRFFGVPTGNSITIERITLKGLVEIPQKPSPRPEPPKYNAPSDGKAWEKIDFNTQSFKSYLENLKDSNGKPLGNTSYVSSNNSLVLKEIEHVLIPLGTDYDKTKPIEVYITGTSCADNQQFRMWSGGRYGSRTSNAETKTANKEFTYQMTLQPDPSSSDYNKVNSFNSVCLCAPYGVNFIHDLEITSIYVYVATDPDFKAYKTHEEININGKADDAYKSVPAIPIASKVGDNTSTTTTASAKLVWNENNLYGYVEVMDENIDATADDNHNYWRDGVEFFLDENNDKVTEWDNNTDAFQYRFTGLTKTEDGTANAPMTDEFAGGSNAARTAYAGIETAYTFIEGGYAVEFKIPFQEAKAADAKVGFDIIVQDCKNGGRDAEIYMRKTSKALSYYNLNDTFGELILKDEAPEASATYEVDLENTITSSNLEGFNTTSSKVTYIPDEQALEATLDAFTGILFKLPEIQSDKHFKYVKVTYTSDSDLNYYVFDSKMTDGGQNDKAAKEITLIKADTDTTVITSEVSWDYIKGIKIFNFGSPMHIKIKSIKFSTDPDI